MVASRVLRPDKITKKTIIIWAIVAIFGALSSAISTGDFGEFAYRFFHTTITIAIAIALYEKRGVSS